MSAERIVVGGAPSNSEAFLKIVTLIGKRWNDTPLERDASTVFGKSDKNGRKGRVNTKQNGWKEKMKVDECKNALWDARH